MKKLLLKYSLFVAISWTVIIFILCATPGNYIPSANWLDLLSFDKFVHASIFFVLVCTWVLHFYRINRMSNIMLSIIVGSCMMYGGLLEIMQANVFSHRSGDWLDFIANSFGCIMGILFCMKRLRINKNQA